MIELEAGSDVGSLQTELEKGLISPPSLKNMDEGYVLQTRTIDLVDAECTSVLEGQLAVCKHDDK